METCKIKNLYNLKETIAADLFEGAEYPWEVLPKIGAFIKELGSILSEEEYDKLMENLNDDDYVEDFMRKANLENELQQLAKAKENLIQHTGFLRLSADERTQLFILYAESNELTKVKLLKTREEGGSTSSCEEQKQAAYRQAKADYDNAVANCQNNAMPSGCLTQAAAKYDRNKRIADRGYENCIKK